MSKPHISRHMLDERVPRGGFHNGEGYRLSGTGEGKWRGGHGESDKILTGEIAVGGSGSFT